jgi:hypothetical protein
MFFLLKKLKVSNSINIIISLVFGYLPIVSYRILGHYTYTSIYIFPLFFLMILKLFQEKQSNKKIFTSILLGLFMTFTVLLNFYYFIGLCLMIFFYLLYFFSARRSEFINTFKNYFKYSLLTLISFFISAFPWIQSVYKLVKENGVEKIKGSGALDLSGDLMGFFTPSEYNPVFRYLIDKLQNLHIVFSKYERFYSNNVEKFNYSGLIILISYLIIIFTVKKIPKGIWKKIHPHFLISLMFAVLTLGPFLKIFNRWLIDLEGTPVVFPMPFLLLRYMPGLASLRASTRFTPLFIFSALIVSAYLLDYIYKKLKGNKRSIFIVALFSVFIMDQYITFPKKPSSYFPVKIYKQIEKTTEQGTVFEIPFTVRDGFQYIGDVHAIGIMNGQLIHKKPIIGGYLARVSNKVFDFYKNLKFIGYIAKIINKSNYDLLKEKPGEVEVSPFPYSVKIAGDEISSLNIKYIIIKNNERYTVPIRQILENAGFFIEQTDGQYDLYVKS